MSSAARRRPLARLLADAALVALVFVAYGPALDAGFVFDDRPLVVENEVVREPPWNLRALLSPTAGSRISYRPLRAFSYMVDTALAGGVEPRAFHRSNLLYHAATVLTLHALARAALGAGTGAFAAAALFAVHPLGTESVAYVAGRRDLLCGLLVLLALRAWWAWLELGVHGRGRDARSGASPRDRRRRALALAAAAVAGTLALAAKETAVVLPLLALLLAAARGRTRGAATSRAARGPALALGGLVAIGAVLLYGERLAAVWHRLWLGPLAPQPALSLVVLGRYLWLALWPARLSADYRLGAFALPTSPLDGRALAAALALGALVAAGVALLRRGRVAGAGLLWFPIAFAPVAQIFPYGEIVAEHNGYLPLAGLCLAAGEGVARLARRRAAPAVALLAVALLVLGARTRARTGDWHDEVSLWRATLRVAPGSLRGRYNLGIAYLREGRLRPAERWLARALEVDPDDPDALLALAEVSARLGRFRRSARLARRAHDIEPSAHALAVLGHAKLALGSLYAARRAFERALALDPGWAPAGLGLDRVRSRLRARREARRRALEAAGGPARHSSAPHSEDPPVVDRGGTRGARERHLLGGPPVPRARRRP